MVKYIILLCAVLLVGCGELGESNVECVKGKSLIIRSSIFYVSENLAIIDLKDKLKPINFSMEGFGNFKTLKYAGGMITVKNSDADKILKCVN